MFGHQVEALNLNGLEKPDTQVLKAICAAVILGFGLIFLLLIIARYAERIRVTNAKDFSVLTAASAEIGTISQRAALIQFGTITQRNKELEARLWDQLSKELDRLNTKLLDLSGDSNLFKDRRVSPATSDAIETLRAKALDFHATALNVLNDGKQGVLARKEIGSFADLAVQILEQSRLANDALALDAARTVEADEQRSFVISLVSSVATLITGLVVIIFVLLRLRRELVLRRNTEDQLVHINRELEQFSAIVAHDLRGPLTNISLSAQLLSKHVGSTNAEVKESTDLIASETERLRRMIQALLEVARLVSAPINSKRVQVSDLISSVRTSLAGLIEKSGASIKCSGAESVNVDPVLFQSLIQNLVENSIKYKRAEAAPDIKLQIRKDSVEWNLIYDDNGMGIPEEKRKVVFDPFTQLDRSSMRNGVGLGLSLVKKITLLHGGTISIESKAEPGVRFMLSFPRKIAKQKPSSDDTKLYPGSRI